MSNAEEFAGLVGEIAERRDRLAFTRLFDHFAPRIKSYLLRLGADDTLAEELTQEVMITLWRKAHLFDKSKSSVATWLFRIARNRRIDAARRDKSGELDPNDPFFIPEDVPPADQAFDEQQRDRKVREAMDTLPAEQLELVRMAFYTGLSHSEIADQTGVPLGTVKSRIRLAFGRLRRSLEADEAADTEL
ncbi:MAG: sigma-70 family RNA polymerase sigma factor [Pseudomonadota bacterium]